MKCSICKMEVNSDTAPILTMGAYGNPRFLCEECAHDIEVATTATDTAGIAEAMDRISTKMGHSEPEELVINTLTGIMASAADRANKIKDGSYDFSSDAAEDGFDEIPDDMLETEEDRALEEKIEEKNKKFDKIFNIISTIVFSALGVYLIYVIINNFFL